MGGARKTIVNADGSIERICRECGVQKPITDYAVAKREDGEPVQWAYECKPCAVKRKAVRRREIRRKEPGYDRRLKAKQQMMQRRWRKANPEKVKASVVRRRKRLQADPRRHAEHLEGRRIEYRLRQERRGIKVRGAPKTAIRLPEREQP